jgi:hypothetical protein
MFGRTVSAAETSALQGRPALDIVGGLQYANGRPTSGIHMTIR